MGWWKDSDKGSRQLLIGDEALDISADYLKHISQMYVDDTDRAPTIYEVIRLLEITLQTYGNELLDMGHLEIEEIIPRFVEQAEQQKYSVGDVFALSLADYGYGYGRIWWISKQLGPICEFFLLISDSICAISQITSAERAFYSGVSDTHLLDRTWRIIGNTTIPESHGIPKFIRDYKPLMDHCDLIEGEDRIRVATDEEVNSLPTRTILGTDSVEKHLIDSLKSNNII